MTIRTLLSFLLIIRFIVLSGQEKKELYYSGKSAFERGAYITALENLSGFEALNEAYLNAHPTIKTAVGSAIRKCKSEIDRARREREMEERGELMQIAALIRPPEPVIWTPDKPDFSDKSKYYLTQNLNMVVAYPFKHLVVECYANFSDNFEANSDHIKSHQNDIRSFAESQDFPVELLEFEIRPPVSNEEISNMTYLEEVPKGLIIYFFQFEDGSKAYDLK